MELGYDDGNSLAISDGTKESLGVGAWLGLELGLLLDGVELGIVNGLVLGTDDGDLLGLDKEGLELGSDDGDSLAISDGQKKKNPKSSHNQQLQEPHLFQH